MFKNKDEGTGSGLGFSSISTINNYACVPCEYAVSPAFQRGTLRANAIYHGPWGMNFSGIFYYGSGNYQAVSYTTFAAHCGYDPGFLGTDRLNSGATTLVVPSKYCDRWTGPTQIAPGQSIPRDAFHALPLYKVDMRLSRDFRFHERFVFTPQVDVFNLLNHPNYGSYNTSLNLRQLRYSGSNRWRFLMCLGNFNLPFISRSSVESSMAGAALEVVTQFRPFRRRDDS